MANATEAWRVPNPPTDDTQPERLKVTTIDLESHLEDWIETDPTLLMPGLALIGRQVNTVAGFVDLLAVDRDGALVIIELKRGATYRDTVAQALDYAAALSRWTPAELKAQAEKYLSERREAGVDVPDSWDDLLAFHADIEPSDWLPGQLRVLVAGNGTDAGVERIVDFLSGRFGVPINAVSFDVFEDTADLIVVRRSVLSEEESRDRARKIARGGTDEDLLNRADESGAKAVATTVLAAWTDAGRTLRAESNYWSVKRPSPHGRQVIAKVYPDHEDADPGGLYVEFKWSKLAQDTELSAAELQAALKSEFGELEDESWAWVASEAEAKKLADVVSTIYSQESTSDENGDASTGESQSTGGPLAAIPTPNDAPANGASSSE